MAEGEVYFRRQVNVDDDFLDLVWLEEGERLVVDGVEVATGPRWVELQGGG